MVVEHPSCSLLYMKIREIFAANLVELRRVRGLSQEALPTRQA